MSSERDDEDLERLLDADQLPGSDTDPLAALLRAAAPPKDEAETEPGPDHVLNGEEAALAAFRAAFAPQPEKTPTPRRRPIRRAHLRTGTGAALSAVALLALAAIVLAPATVQNPQQNSSPAASTTQLTPPPTDPGPSNSAALPLDNNTTLTTAPHNPQTNSTHASATPSATGHAHPTKTPHSQSTHKHNTRAGGK